MSKFNPGIIALSIGAFGIGVTEFAPMGLLPVIAADLGVSIPSAGLLISAYAGPSAVLIFLWGVASFALVPPLQVRVMSAAADAPNLASAVNIGAFNLGNAFGAALGGGVIAGEMGLPAVAVAGAVTSAVGLIAVLLAIKNERNMSDLFAETCNQP